MNNQRAWINRRTVLRGGLVAGAAVSLPLPRLGAMLNANGTAYADGNPLPSLFGVWYFGGGVIPIRFVPKSVGSGDAWELSEQLAPLGAAGQDVKSHLTVITGMDFTSDEQIFGNPHQSAVCQALTGTTPRPKEDPDRSGPPAAPSIDQVILEHSPIFRGAPELHLRNRPAYSQDDFVETSLKSSWQYNVPETVPRKVFASVFGTPPGGPQGAGPAPQEMVTPKLLRARKSVLDLVLLEAQRLRGRLGAEDKIRLDSHLDGIRKLEQQIDGLPSRQVSCQAAEVGPLPGYEGEDYNTFRHDVEEAMTEIMVRALACDRTRLFTYTLFRGGGDMIMTNLGQNTLLHYLHHGEGGEPHGDDPRNFPGGRGDQPQVNAAIVYVMDRLAKLLGKMKNQQEGSGNLLDRACIYISSDIGWGYTHQGTVTMIAGKAKGQLKGNAHVSKPGKGMVSQVFDVVGYLNGAAANPPAGFGAILA